MSYATARQRLAMWPGPGETAGRTVGIIEPGEQVAIIHRESVVRGKTVTEWIKVRRGERFGWVRAANVREGD